MITIEVPLYTYPLEKILGLKQAGYQLIVFGGFPDSPLNGGRFNGGLDGFSLEMIPPEELRAMSLNSTNPFALTVTSAKAGFYRHLDVLNKNGIPFFLVFTNMFIEKNELSETNMEPIKRLVESGKKYNLKNGITLYNPILEAAIKNLYGDQLAYISSCTKYFIKERHLSTTEAIKLYLADEEKYDQVVLTPYHSRNSRVLKTLSEKKSDKFTAVTTSACGRSCNSYWHYDMLSRMNKRSLATYTITEFNNLGSDFMKHDNFRRCPVSKMAENEINFESGIKEQLKYGYKNFKIGRGIGENCLDLLLYEINNA